MPPPPSPGLQRPRSNKGRAVRKKRHFSLFTVAGFTVKGSKSYDLTFLISFTFSVISKKNLSLNWETSYCKQKKLHTPGIQKFLDLMNLKIFAHFSMITPRVNTPKITILWEHRVIGSWLEDHFSRSSPTTGSANLVRDNDLYQQLTAECPVCNKCISTTTMWAALP
jgi:hypothetical protein